jgi:peptidoglycan/LPS O-acetylase OafA/YrhL
MKTPSFHLYKMDVLRGFAIIMVFSLHALQVYTGHHIEVETGGPWLKDFSGQPWYLIFYTLSPIGYGWTGVQLFFVLSGFLIHYSYLRRGVVNLKKKDFFIKRFFRIYPPYFFALLFFAFLGGHAALSSKNGLYDFVSHLLMTYNFDPDTYFSFNGSFWSLALEIQLYLIYPVFLWIRKKQGIEKTILILFGMYVFFSVTRYFITNDYYVFFSHGNVLKNWIIWGLGAWLGENYFSGKQTWPVKSGWIWFMFFAFSTLKAFPFMSGWIDIVWTVFYVILANHYLFSKRTIPVNWEKVLINLGESSYSFYLLHQPILVGLASIISILGLSGIHPAFHFLDAVVIFIIIHLISIGYYQLMEKPSIEIGRKLIKKSTEQ